MELDLIESDLKTNPRMEVMLVLTRKLQQGIEIADNICVTVLQIQGGRVKLGVSAPEHVEVCRKEVADKVAKRTPQVALVPHC